MGELLLHTQLYEEVLFDQHETRELVKVIFPNATFDCYCVECAQRSTFQVFMTNSAPKALTEYALFGTYQGKAVTERGPKVPLNVYVVTATCARNYVHAISFAFRVALPNHENPGLAEVKLARTLTKIGQFPSRADITQPELDRFSKVLKKDVLADLKRGVGLAAHDVGIGAFVYLRRVFEHIVEVARAESAATLPSWDEGEFQAARMSEKIKLVASRLPSLLAETPNLYGVLSKGVHELSEQECLNYFEPVLAVIEVALEDRLSEFVRKQKTTAAVAAIGKIASQIASPGTQQNT